MVEIPEQVLHDLKNSRSIVATTHVHPDGDALGSLLGFAFMMESLGKEVFCLIEEPVSSLYQFLPGSERLYYDLNLYHEFAAQNGPLTGVSLDCGDRYRLGDKLGQELLSLTPFVVLDHHASHQKFGTSRWVDVESSSTGEMVYKLAKSLGATLSYEVAYNLFVAIVTDTGSFRYDCTSAQTLRVAAELVDLGVCVEDVSAKVYDNYSPGRLLLLQKVLSSIKLHTNNHIAVMLVTQEMLHSTGTTMNDTEMFINFPRSVDSVKVAVFIKEGAAGNFSVSLRAKGEVDVSEIAEEFDGGGHRNAAGFRQQNISLSELQNTILDKVGTAIANIPTS